MAKAKKISAGTKGYITKLFKQGKTLPEIKEITDVPVPRIKTILKKHLMEVCDKLWSEAVKLEADNICLVDKKPCNTNSHHMIGRSNYKYRWVLANGLCLGAYRHSMANDMAAHGSTSATQAFADWLARNASKRWQWFEEHRYDHELIKVDVFFLLDTMRRLEQQIELLKDKKPDLLARRRQ